MCVCSSSSNVNYLESNNWRISRAFYETTGVSQICNSKRDRRYMILISFFFLGCFFFIFLSICLSFILEFVCLLLCFLVISLSLDPFRRWMRLWIRYYYALKYRVYILVKCFKLVDCSVIQKAKQNTNIHTKNKPE